MLFSGDMFTPENGEKEPDWVLTERQHFHQIRDENKVNTTFISEGLIRNTDQYLISILSSFKVAAVCTLALF